MNQVTVTLASGQEKAHQLVPGKYEKREKQPDGSLKSYLYFITELGKLEKMPYGDYITLINEEKRDTKLSIKNYNFTSKIINLTQNIDARDLKLNHMGLTFSEKGKDKADLEFWEKHPDAVVNGVSNGGRNIYNVTFESKLKNQISLERKERQKINNIIDSIAESSNAHSELRDLLLYLGVTPGSRSVEEMVNALTVGENVIAMNGNKSFSPAILFQDNNVDAFYRFMNDGDPNKAVILVIEKAKIYHKITLNTDSKNNKGWYFKMAYLGLDNAEIVRTLNENKKMYESLSKEILMEESNGDTDNDENLIPEAASAEKINRKNDKIEELNKLINAHKVELPRGCNIMSMSDEDLDFYIEQGKEEMLTGAGTDKAEGESPMKYRGRLLGKIKSLIEKGEIEQESIGDRTLNKLTAEEAKNILDNYYSKITSPITQ